MKKSRRTSFKVGTVEMLALFLLSKRDMYAYELCSLLNKLSDGKYSLLETSLYPTLYKMVKEGLLSDYTKVVGERRLRVYYQIESPGTKRLDDLLNEYRSIVSGIDMILSCDIPST